MGFYCVTSDMKKQRSLSGRWNIKRCFPFMVCCPCPGVWFSRCYAYQGSFLKSSKSVVNCPLHIRESACFQGFAEIIKVFNIILPFVNALWDAGFS